MLGFKCALYVLFQTVHISHELTVIISMQCLLITNPFYNCNFFLIIVVSIGFCSPTNSLLLFKILIICPLKDLTILKLKILLCICEPIAYRLSRRMWEKNPHFLASLAAPFMQNDCHCLTAAAGSNTYYSI